MDKRGTISGIFNERADFFYGLNIQSNIAERIYNKAFNEQAVESIISRTEKENIEIITLEDERYLPSKKADWVDF